MADVYTGMAPNTWLRVQNGTGGPPNGIMAYSGMAVDTVNGKLLVFGGGHQDYWGNDVWAFDIMAQTWTQLYVPEPFWQMSVATASQGASCSEPGKWTATGRPLSRHTYTSVNFITHLGLMFVGGSSTYNEAFWDQLCYYNDPQDSWTFNYVGSSWVHRGSRRTNSAQAYFLEAAYNPTAQVIMGIINQGNGELWTWNPSTNVWAQKATGPGRDPHRVCCFDSTRNLFYLYGGDFPADNNIYSYNLTNNTWATLAATNKPPAGGGWGMDYDSVNDRVAIFGRDGLWIFNPGTLAWTKPTTTSPPGNRDVTFGDFKYDPIRNVFFLLGGGNGSFTSQPDVWAYRLAGGSVAAPLTIATTTLPNGTTGTAYSQTLVATSGTAPLTWSISVGALPTGLSLASSTGVISGTPTTVQTANFTAQVADADETDTQTLAITIVGAAVLSVTTATLPNGLTGSAYSQQLAATGGVTPYSWVVLTGSLPTGLTLSSSGLISGTPTLAGTSVFTVQVTDSLSVSATKQFSLVVSTPGPFSIDITAAELLPFGVSGVARTNEPVTVGVPLADTSNVVSIASLGLTGPAAGQFRILGRYPSGNAKWVLVDYQTSLSAGGSATIQLVSGSGNFGGSNLATDAGATISIDTGSAQFVIKKANFNVFDSVVVSGQTFVSTGNAGGLVIRNSTGTEYTSSADAASTAVIEENGPVRTVVKCDGILKNGALRMADYTMRIHFFKNKSYVKSYLTLRNADKDAAINLVFASFEARVPVVIAGTKTLEFSRATNVVTGTLGASETGYVFQGFTQDKKISYSDGLKASVVSGDGLKIQVGATVLNALGNQSEWSRGWAEVRNSTQKGVTLAMRWMSANWPAGIELKDDGTTAIEMFSKQNPINNLKLMFGKHESREILWDFHTATPNNLGLLYSLEYPIGGRSTFEQYRSTGAFYGQTELVTAAQQASWFSAMGQSAVSPNLANPPMQVYRTWPWGTGGGDNQTDFPLNDLMDYVRTGSGGFYLFGEQRSIFNANAAVRHSDDFDGTLSSRSVTDPAGQASLSGEFYDFEHTHIMSLPIYYWMSGNEHVRESTLDAGEWLERSEVDGDYSLPDVSYFRAWCRKYRNFAICYEFSKQLGVPYSVWKGHVDETTNFVLDSRDNPPNNQPRGRNLNRGYLHWDSDVYDTVFGRVVHSLFHTQIFFEAIYQVRRVMQTVGGWGYARLEEMSDMMTAISQFWMDEVYAEQGDATAIHNFGVIYNYPLDQVHTIGDQWDHNLDPYDMSRLAVWAYTRLGTQAYLNRAYKMLWGITGYATNRSPSELQGQSLMYAYFNPPSPWQVLNLGVVNNGGGSYTLSWTVPQGASQIEIKHSNKTIVPTLGFNDVSRTYTSNPATFTPYYAATNLTTEPIPAGTGTLQSMNVSGLSCGTACFFSARVAPGGIVGPPAPSAPTGLRKVSN